MSLISYAGLVVEMTISKNNLIDVKLVAFYSFGAERIGMKLNY